MHYLYIYILDRHYVSESCTQTRSCKSEELRVNSEKINAFIIFHNMTDMTPQLYLR